MKQKNHETIKTVVGRGICTGCGTCIAICPDQALSLTLDQRKGIYVPAIKAHECTGCGLCVKACPGHEVDFRRLNQDIFHADQVDAILGHHKACYYGHALDKGIRHSGASGGIVTSLLIYLLEERIIDGALVTRMKESSPLEPEPFIARTAEEITSAAESKYCPVPANVALKEILEVEGNYAVVGLPCHIHGIRKAAQINSTIRNRIALHIGLFCGHNPSFRATEFLLWRHGLCREEVSAVKYRSGGWPGGLTFQLAGGGNVFIPYQRVWESLDLAFTPRRCLECFDGAAELADISFGDAWLPEFAEDKKGLSLIHI